MLWYKVDSAYMYLMDTDRCACAVAEQEDKGEIMGGYDGRVVLGWYVLGMFWGGAAVQTAL